MQSKKQSSIHDTRYQAAIQVLIESRKAAGFSQSQLADKLGMTQPDISKLERLERRIDMTELIDFLNIVSSGDKEKFSQLWMKIYDCHR